MNRFLMGGMIVGMIAALGALPAPAQNPVQNPLQNPAENQNSAQITVAFSNPSQPRRLVVKTLMHKVTIKGYDGKDAIIESSAISERRRRERNIPPGMHPLNVGRGGIEVTEANNVVTVSAETPLGGGDIQIQVPVETSVTVNTINNGVSVERILLDSTDLSQVPWKRKNNLRALSNLPRRGPSKEAKNAFGENSSWRG